MGDTAVKVGQSFSNAVAQAYPLARDATLNALIPGRPLIQAAAPTIQDFLSGATGGFVPRSPSNSVTVALPPVTKAAAPAAVAAAPAAAAKAAVVDPNAGVAGLSGLSFRQLLTLAQTGQAEQRATPKPVTSSDQAGQFLNSIYQAQFSKSLEAAGKDTGKQQAAIDELRKQTLPMALRGNTADSSIFDGIPPGQTVPGAQ